MAGMFDFPMDLYPTSYSGPGPQATGLISSLLPQMKSTFENLPGQRQEHFTQARGDINRGYDTAISGLGGAYKRALHPALQQVLNSMGSRNMLNSSVAGESMGNAARGLGESVLDRQSALELARNQALAGVSQREGETAYQLPQLLTQLLGQGRYSESSDPGMPYRSALGFLQNLMA